MSIHVKFAFQRKGFRLDTEFSFPGKGVSALFGPSGCGKSTLLRLIAGLEKSANGYVRINGQIWQDEQQFIPTHKRSVGYVFQEASLFSHLTVRKNLEYGMGRAPQDTELLGFERVNRLLGTGPLLDRRPAELSGGERQRVAIARALLAHPKLLLMDEPMAALDLQSRAEILPFLERLHEDLNIPVLYVSHSPDEVAKLADHLILMAPGRILGSGPIVDMLTRDDLPLSHEMDAASLIKVRVTGYDETYDLTYLTFPGGTFTLPGNHLANGQDARLRVLSRDISLTLAAQTDTSILNIFPASVVEISSENAAQVTVHLDIAGTRVLSRITRKSAARLNLAVGNRIYAQVKSVALL